MQCVKRKGVRTISRRSGGPGGSLFCSLASVLLPSMDQAQKDLVAGKPNNPLSEEGPNAQRKMRASWRHTRMPAPSPIISRDFTSSNKGDSNCLWFPAQNSRTCDARAWH